MIPPDEWPKCEQPGCTHPWHGLRCTWSSCECPSSIPNPDKEQ